jgi:hypothetical protein
MAGRPNHRWLIATVVAAGALTLGSAFLLIPRPKRHRAGWYVYQSLFGRRNPNALDRIRLGLPFSPAPQLWIRHFRPSRRVVRILVGGFSFGIPRAGLTQIDADSVCISSVKAVRYWMRAKSSGAGRQARRVHDLSPSQRLRRPKGYVALWLDSGNYYLVPRGARVIRCYLRHNPSWRTPLRLPAYNATGLGGYGVSGGDSPPLTARSILLHGGSVYLIRLQTMMRRYGLSDAGCKRLVDRIISSKLRRLTDTQIVQQAVAISGPQIRMIRNPDKAVWEGLLIASDPPVSPGPVVWIALPKHRTMYLQTYRRDMLMTIYNRHGMAVRGGYLNFSYPLPPLRQRLELLKSAVVAYWLQRPRIRAEPDRDGQFRGRQNSRRAWLGNQKNKG